MTESVEKLKELDDEEDKLIAYLLAIKREKKMIKNRADLLFKQGSLIVKSDPTSYSRNPVAPLTGDPLASETTLADFD